MAFTNYPNGVSSMGIPLVGRNRANGGKHYFVNGQLGSDGRVGQSPDAPLATMTAAFTQLTSGDTVHLNGRITENCTTPAGVFDVAVVGESNRPRHADAHTAYNGQKAAADWRATSASSPNVTVQQQGWSFENILFVGASSSVAILLTRDAGSGDAERDSGHASIVGCRFASGATAISDTGGNVNVLVKGNRFEALTTACILGVGNIGVGQSDWEIVDNTFDGFTNGVKIAGFGCRIQNNTFTAGGTPNTTYVLNTNNGGGSNNFIVGNFFQTATANFNTPDVVGTTTDVWFNVSIDATSAGVGGNYEAGQPA